jgi:hypothetical protein
MATMTNVTFEPLNEVPDINVLLYTDRARKPADETVRAHPRPRGDDKWFRGRGTRSSS